MSYQVERRMEALKRYYQDPNRCDGCREVIEVPPDKKPSYVRRRSYCGKSCSNSDRLRGNAKERKMLTCQNCGEEFPRRRDKNGRCYDTKYCDDCYREVPESKKCEKCKREFPNTDEYFYSQYKGNGNLRGKCKDCLNKERAKDVQKTRDRKINQLVKEFGGKCIDCGFDRSIKALSFHHVQGKEEEISNMLARNASMEELRKEAEKCKLLCLNCHIIRHE